MNKEQRLQKYLSEHPDIDLFKKYKQKYRKRVLTEEQRKRYNELNRILYRKNNPIEKRKVGVKLSKEEIKQRKSERSKKWYNSEKGKLHRQKNNRSRRVGAVGKVKWEDWIELKKKYNNTCLCCKKQEPEIKLTSDHIIPVSKGGKHCIENIQPLCMKCNCSKFTKIIDYRKDHML